MKGWIQCLISRQLRRFLTQGLHRVTHCQLQYAMSLTGAVSQECAYL